MTKSQNRNKFGKNQATEGYPGTTRIQTQLMQSQMRQ